jgi:hypothetical protein
MSLGDNQKPRATWWHSSAAGRSWFSAVKEKLADREVANRSFRTGSRIGLKQSLKRSKG